MELVAIKVKIPLNSKGHHAYPNFNLLDSSVRGGTDWAKYVDANGGGWHYDKVSGHGFSDANNPDVPPGHKHRNDDPAVWYGCLCVPEPFALAAEAMFPTQVELLSETDFELFHDDRAHAHEPEEIFDKDVVESIMTQRKAEAEGLMPAPSAAKIQARADAMDPTKTARGVRKNLRRKYVDYKASRGFTLKNIPRP